jgi:hypothetical protein
MFWILDVRTGTRKLLDPLALHVNRLQSGDPVTDAAGDPNAAAGSVTFATAGVAGYFYFHSNLPGGIQVKLGSRRRTPDD